MGPNQSKGVAKNAKGAQLLESHEKQGAKELSTILGAKALGISPRRWKRRRQA